MVTTTRTSLREASRLSNDRKIVLVNETTLDCWQCSEPQDHEMTLVIDSYPSNNYKNVTLSLKCVQCQTEAEISIEELVAFRFRDKDLFEYWTCT